MRSGSHAPGGPALFLDRDGVINRDTGHVCRVEDFVWLPGVFDTVRTANALGLAVIVVTNQAGIAKGLYTEADFHRLTDWMKAQFAAAAASLTDVYFCPDHPDAVTDEATISCRKPAPGMLLRAAREHGLDLPHSVLIGDQESDIEAGRAAGLGGTALFAPDGPASTRADVILASHADACAWLTLALSRAWKPA
jgi:D-glycero-D-manno-heptose 1,7-bisphosphate phosphatase